MCILYHQPSSIQQWGLHGIKPNWVSIIHHATLCSMSSTLCIHSCMAPCRIGFHALCEDQYKFMHCPMQKWSPHSQVQVMHVIFLMLRILCKMIPSFTPTTDAHHIPHVTHTLQNDPLNHPNNWCTSYSSCYTHFAKWSPHSPQQVMHIIFTFIPTHPLIPLCFWRLLMPTPNLTV